MNKIYLEKKNQNGVPVMWEAWTEGNKTTYRYGQVGGKIQTKIETVKAGKNIGKINEKTAADSALFIAETKALKKIEGGYELIKGAISEHETKQEKDRSIPAPMLAHEYQKQGKKLSKQIFVQPKFDGIRGLFDLETGFGYSRNGKRIMGVPHVEEQIKKLKTKGIRFIDGELYTPELTFEDIISVTKKTKTLADEKLRNKICLYAFDVIAEDKTLVFEKRVQLLTQVDGQQKNIKISECKVIENAPKNIEHMHNEFVDDGYEGIMLRNNTPYENKRSYNLQKYKHFFDAEYTVIGFEQQENEDTLGALICEDAQKRVFKARPKMTHAAKQEIWDNQKKYLGKRVTVKYQELTSYGIPRFPVAIAFRDYE